MMGARPCSGFQLPSSSMAYRLGQPQVAWLNDEEDGRVNWVHLSTRLLVASIFVLVGEAGPRVVNPLIGGLLHYNELAVGRGANTAYRGEAASPVACVLGILGLAL